MKMMKSILAGVASLAIAASSYANQSDSSGALVGSGGGMLKFGGDVRFEFNSISESINAVPQRGGGALPTTATKVFTHRLRPTLNLTVDYSNNNTWASGTVRWRQNGGTTTGSSNNVSLRYANAGVNLMEDGAFKLDLAWGRWAFMSDLFSSSLQFDSTFDGAAVTYSNSYEGFGDFMARFGGFQVDNTTDHYGWAVEASLANISDTGLWLRYNYADWEKDNMSRTVDTGSNTVAAYNGGSTTLNYWQYWAFRTSEVAIGYDFTPELLNGPMSLYGSYLVNHAAKRISTTNKKENRAWMLGAQYGSADKAGKWSLKAEYQSVQEQAVRRGDVGGYGRNDAAEPNYKGYQVKFTHAFTDDLSMVVRWDATNHNKKSVDDMRTAYKFLEIETIYTF